MGNLITSLPIALAVLLVGSAAAWSAPRARTGAGSKMASLPLGRYRDFALSRDLSSLDPKNPTNALFIRQGLGRPVSVLARGDGWAQVQAASVGSTLRMPLGWFGVDRGDSTQFWTPNYRTLVSLQFLDALVAVPEEKREANRESPAQLFARARRFAGTLAGADAPSTSKPRQFALRDGSVGIETLNLAGDNGGRQASLLVLTPNPRRPRFPMALQLSTPMSLYRRDQALVGLILRDRKINWAQQP